MYSEQSLLPPPPLPGSPRFTLPPLDSPRFSTTLPRLPYTGNVTSSVTTTTATQPHRESGVENMNTSNAMAKVDRWRLPPLLSSATTTSSSSISSNYQAPFSPYNNNMSSPAVSHSSVNKVTSTTTATTTTTASAGAYAYASPYSYNNNNRNSSSSNSSTYQSTTQTVQAAPPQPSSLSSSQSQVPHVLPSTTTAATAQVPVPSSQSSSLGYRYDMDRHRSVPPAASVPAPPAPPPSSQPQASSIWRSTSSLQNNNKLNPHPSNLQKSNSVFIKHEAARHHPTPSSHSSQKQQQQQQQPVRQQKSPRFMSTSVPDDPYYYYGDESNRSTEWMDEDTIDYTTSSTTHLTTTATTHARSNRMIEFTERTLEINHEFLENKETIYLEKIKKLQNELSAIQHGGHEEFEEFLFDMEEERSKVIKEAQFYMEYRIQCAEKLYNDALRAVEEEAEVEKRDLKKAMLFIIEEKRKRIKEYRDEEISLTNDFVITAPQTRSSNRRRTTRNTATNNATSITEGSLTLEQVLAMNKNGVKTSKRRNNDRSRDLAGLAHSLNGRTNEVELEADYEAMRKSPQERSSSFSDDDEYMEDEHDLLSTSPKRARNQYPSNNNHRSSRR